MPHFYYDFHVYTENICTCTHKSTRIYIYEIGIVCTPHRCNEILSNAETALLTLGFCVFLVLYIYIYIYIYIYLLI